MANRSLRDRLAELVSRLKPLRESAFWAILAAGLGYFAVSTGNQIAGFLTLGAASIAVLVGIQVLPRAIGLDDDSEADDWFGKPPGEHQTPERLLVEGDIIRLIGPNHQAAVRISRLALIARWSGSPPVLELRQYDDASLRVELKDTIGLMELEDALRVLDGYPRGRLHDALGDMSGPDTLIWERDDG